MCCLPTLLRAGAEARALFSLPCQRLGRGVCCRRGGGRGGASALAALRESCQREHACAVRKRRAGAFNLISGRRTYGYDPGRPGPCWVIAPGGSTVGRLKDNGRTRALGPSPTPPLSRPDPGRPVSGGPQSDSNGSSDIPWTSRLQRSERGENVISALKHDQGRQ